MMMANKINKFENNQNIEIEYRTKNDRDTMLKIIEEIREIKREKRYQRVAEMSLLNQGGIIESKRSRDTKRGLKCHSSY